MAVLGNTTTGLRNLNGSILGALTCPGPPLSEQRAIADYLDTETARIDALITKKRRMIELLDVRWSALRREVVLGSLDPVSGDPGSALQVVLNLGVLIELQRGHDLPVDSRAEGVIPVVSSGGVSGTHHIAAARGPGVITGRYGTIGEVYFIENDYWPLNTTLYVKDFRGNDPRWVYHLLAALPLDAEKDKSAVTGINRNVIGKLRVPRPTHETQVAIAARLDHTQRSIEAAVDRLSDQLDLLAEHRQALITATVTGAHLAPG
jgi:type I restriction enzyme S subunit